MPCQKTDCYPPHYVSDIGTKIERLKKLKPQENVWQYIKDRGLANRTFDNTHDILNACCQAWNFFATSKDLIVSLNQKMGTTLLIYIFDNWYYKDKSREIKKIVSSF